jgi:hypothetical protein
MINERKGERKNAEKSKTMKKQRYETKAWEVLPAFKHWKYIV